jgi:hypothetical protein
VGKTTTTINDVGVALLASGNGGFTRSSGVPLNVNRKTDDGTIISVRKDGTEVGVIGTQNWGIGTSSPDRALEISGSSNTASTLRIKNTAPTPDNIWDFVAEYNSGDIKILDDGTERMRIDSSGKVGINTTSPQKTFVVSNGGAEGFEISPTDVSATIRQIAYNRSTSSHLAFRYGALQHEFHVSDQEKMRIDSSGNLLVGKTNNALSNDGIVIREGGEILATNTSDLTANFNRLSTDGDIVSFYKDGTTIGKIGVFASDNIYLSGNSSHAGIQFGSESVLGFKNSSIANNTLDLGNGTAQWRDLYLGGGLYVGGTGSANYLDDYEEGTWSPTILIDGGAGTNLTYENEYVKVGRLVTISCKIRVNAFSTPTGAVTIGGTLPFSPDHGFIIKPSNRALDFSGDAHLKINDGNTTIYTRTSYDQDYNDANNEVTTADARSIKVLEFSATYQTTA